MIMENHIIEITETEGDRSYWECECGTSGSCPAEADVGIAAERHIPQDEGAIYRTRGKW